MIDENILYMDGYEDCFIGYIERFAHPHLACYDKDKVIAKLEKDGMTLDEAVEFYEFNQVGAWMGEYTPCFLLRQTREDYENS